MPPLPPEPEDSAQLGRAAKRVTMDFSLLSAPLPVLPQGSAGLQDAPPPTLTQPGEDSDIPLQVPLYTRP